MYLKIGVYTRDYYKYEGAPCRKVGSSDRAIYMDTLGWSYIHYVLGRLNMHEPPVHVFMIIVFSATDIL